MPTGSTISVEALVLVETSGERDLGHRTNYIGILLAERLRQRQKLVMRLSVFKTEIVCSGKRPPWPAVLWTEQPRETICYQSFTVGLLPIWIGVMQCK